MTVFTEGRLRMNERMMRDTGERNRRDSCGRDRASDRKSAQRGAKKAATGKRIGGQRGCIQG